MAPRRYVSRRAERVRDDLLATPRPFGVGAELRYRNAALSGAQFCVSTATGPHPTGSAPINPHPSGELSGAHGEPPFNVKSSSDALQNAGSTEIFPS